MSSNLQTQCAEIASFVSCDSEVNCFPKVAAIHSHGQTQRVAAIWALRMKSLTHCDCDLQLFPQNSATHKRGITKGGIAENMFAQFCTCLGLFAGGGRKCTETVKNSQKRTTMHKNVQLCVDTCNTPIRYTLASVHPKNGSACGISFPFGLCDGKPLPI